MLDLQVHKYEKVRGTANEVRLVETRPYLRLCAQGGPPVFIQKGRVYSEGGPEIDTLPEWFQDEIAKTAPAALAEVGWQGAAPASSPAIASAPTTPSDWTCPDCGKSMPTKQKGVHTMHHRRKVVKAGSV